MADSMLRYFTVLTVVLTGGRPSPLAAAQTAPICALERGERSPQDGSPADVFGWSVAVDGDTLAVGAFRDDDAGQDAGSVYVFRDDGMAWVFEQKLLALDGAALDGFGQSLALDGNTLVAGAYKDDDAGNNSGSAYVFVRAGTSWTQQAKIVASDGDAGDWFGYSVGLDGDRVVVGAPFRSDPVEGGGGAYVFARSGTSWSEESRLVPTAGSAGDALGWDVAISGVRAVVTAVFDAPAGPGSGSATVFVRAGTTWSEEQQLVASDGESGDQLGIAADIAAGRIVLGARFGGPADAGAAYVFEHSGGSWSEAAALTASDGAADDSFGWDVALAPGVLAVSAPFDQDAGVDTGSTYVYANAPPGSWTELPKIVASDAAAGDSFGFRLGVREARVVVGAPLWKPGASTSGSVYTFALLDAPSVYCTAKTNSCGSLPRMDFDGAPSASMSSGFEAIAHNTRSAKAGLLLYGDQGGASTPFQGGFLCVHPAPLKRSIPVIDTSGTPGQCDGSLRIDLNAFAAGALGGNPLPSLAVAGTQIHCQFWGRDTLANGSLLTDGLRYWVCP